MQWFVKQTNQEPAVNEHDNYLELVRLIQDALDAWYGDFQDRTLGDVLEALRSAVVKQGVYE